MQILWKTLADFVGSNGLQALIESGVLVFFWLAVLGAMISSVRPSAVNAPTATLRTIVTASNFNYVATVVAGLVLTAATGAIGGKPAQLPPQNGTPQAAAPVQAAPSIPAPKPQPVGDPQKQAFQLICGWSYIGLGILCLVVFVIPSPTTHDLVKTVGLTTLGFAGTIIGGLANPN